MVPPDQVRFRAAQVEMAHGAGGKATRQIVDGLLVPLLGNPRLAPLADAAMLELGEQRLAFTVDSFVVRPLRFAGGSIGTLAVNGTANDLAVSGARPESLVLSLVLEAGLPGDLLRHEVEAIADAARRAEVEIVGGDTKVVENGKADGMYVTTAGVGRVDARVDLSATRVEPGDRILLSGPIGDHGITILLERGDLDLEADLVSDSRSVYPLVRALIETQPVPGAIRWMRDPTRGGVATALNELARACGLGIDLDESRLPVRPAVRGACELLGLDPLHIANEGQFLAVVASDAEPAMLAALRSAPGGELAACIGAVVADHPRTVCCASDFGGTRVVDVLIGDPLPRIC